MTDAAPIIPLCCPHAPPRTDEAGPWLICVPCADAFAAERERAVWEAAAKLIEEMACAGRCLHDICPAHRYGARQLRARAEKT